jgi:sn-glycerol 3-phosphate transport system substrate-binding protein
MFRVAIALMAALLAVPVAAAEKTGAKKAAAHKTVPPTQIQFWHAMSGARGAEIDELVARFNASQKAVRVVATYKGPYDVVEREAFAAQHAKNGPDLVQIYEVGTADMIAARDAVMPIWRLMANAGTPLKHEAFVPAVAAYFSDSKGRLLALPFNTSTPVLYYNKDAFRKAGLDPEQPPKTWYQMPKTLGAVLDSGAAKCGLTTTWPSWVLLENMGAWHNQPFATEDNGLAGTDARLNFNTRLMVRWVSMLGSWYRAGYFSWSGRGDAAEARFASGECALLTASSSSYADLRRAARFDFGVAQLPYYDDYPEAPQNTLIGGAGLWAMGGKSRAKYHAVAQFIAYLAKPEVQAQWHQSTGYVPITKAAYELTEKSGFYLTHPGYQVAIRQLLLRNPTRESKGIRLGHFLKIRAIIEDELEAVWGERKTPIDALNEAVARGNALLEQFDHANVPAKGKRKAKAASK